MKKIFLYGYAKCSTCRKATKWLDKNNIKYNLIDIVREPPSKKFLEFALIQLSPDKKKIFNTRGKSFKSIDYEIKDLSNEKIIKLLINDGKLIKRPVLIIDESKFVLGFNESEYSYHLNN